MAMNESIKATFENQDKRPRRGSWAPGEYFCRCAKCKETFIGDKRAMNCADCAYEAEPVSLLQAVQWTTQDLSAWLLDRTQAVFEEEPEIDAIRLRLEEALAKHQEPKNLRSVELMEAEVVRLEKRVQELLEHNTALLNRARAAEAEKQPVPVDK